jgi:hypothetical protein
MTFRVRVRLRARGDLVSSKALILAGADTQVRDSEGRLPVDLLQDEDRRRRAIYEEAVEEVDRQVLKPVLK